MDEKPKPPALQPAPGRRGFRSGVAESLKSAAGARVDPAKSQFAADFRAACAAQTFDLEYQPQVDLVGRRVASFEALLRWRHPSHGDVSPCIFIPLAEELGLIDDIGHWVLDRACRDAAAWPADVAVAINISPLQLNDLTLPARVAAALRASGLPASRLELELTETIAMPENSACLASLRDIKNSGVAIVMDDFDIGYSALGYLLSFPFTKIKIDHTFIRQLPHKKGNHEDALKIVRSIIGLCKDLGIGCCAEGVETEEQLAMLVAANCPEVQGYFLGRPQPADSVARVLNDIPERLRQIDAENGSLSAARHRSTLEAIPFFQLAETAHDILIVTTAELDLPGPVIIYVNPAFTRLTGYSAEEALGLTPRILQGPGTSRSTRDIILRELRAGWPVHEKILNFAKSGAPYWLDLQIVPLRNAKGEITHFAAIERDVTMDKRRLDELEYLADRDTLTGISNRRSFLRSVRSECEAADGEGPSASESSGPCLAFIDVDNFKQVNDELGHAAGDAVLCGLADCLADNVRRLDILGRIGGEEFGVCMPGVTLRDAAALAERLRCAIARTELATPSGPVTITASIGVACYGAGDTVGAVTDRADAAMYDAKRGGRNRVRTREPTSAHPAATGPER